MTTGTARMPGSQDIQQTPELALDDVLRQWWKRYPGCFDLTGECWALLRRRLLEAARRLRQAPPVGRGKPSE